MKKKIWYLDNIRFILAIFVVAWHAANAYIGGRWPILETDTSSVVYGIKTFFDAVTMPFFFYISGYFALVSIRKRGSSSFLKTKVKTILIPWIVVLLLIVPFIELLAQISTQSLAVGYFDLWKWQINRIFAFDFGFISDGYYQRYMWFLSVLFAFQAIFALVYRFSKKWLNKDLASLQSRLFTTKSTLTWVVKVAFIALLPMMTVILLTIFFTDSPDPEAFFSVFNVIQFQASRLPVYIVYFVLGILTYRNQWIRRDLFTNRRLWNTLFVITGVIYLIWMNLFANIVPDELFGPLFILFINFFIVSALGFTLSNAKIYLDRPLFGNGEITSHAYNIYILHYIFVHLLQLALLNFVAIPLLVKFVLVTTIGLVLSVLASKYLLKPQPRLTVAIGLLSTILLFGIFT